MPWRDLPDHYGPWETVYGLLFCRRQRRGTWHRIVEQVQVRADAKGLITWDISVDFTIAHAHQQEAGARKGGICRSSRPVVYSPNPGSRLLALHRGRTLLQLALGVRLFASWVPVCRGTVGSPTSLGGLRR
ncbi:hypothetical protein [Streptomyces sp. CBMA156]|uniref:hypothetical protein n=1 Tax=Streptomyces sp. CBMA156 TaxID=1930280 RepID=UPI0029500399|nr:hypothetical protein [Streptomyces sp. CBMA156]